MGCKKGESGEDGCGEEESEEGGCGEGECGEGVSGDGVRSLLYNIPVALRFVELMSLSRLPVHQHRVLGESRPAHCVSVCPCTSSQQIYGKQQLMTTFPTLRNIYE